MTELERKQKAEALIAKKWIKINTLSTYSMAREVPDNYEINTLTHDVRNTLTGNLLRIDEGKYQGSERVTFVKTNGIHNDLSMSKMIDAIQRL